MFRCWGGIGQAMIDDWFLPGRDTVQSLFQKILFLTVPTTSGRFIFSFMCLPPGQSAIKPRQIERCSIGCSPWKFLPRRHGFSGDRPERPSGSWPPLIPRPFSHDRSVLLDGQPWEEPMFFRSQCAPGNLQRVRIFLCRLRQFCASTQCRL